MPESWAPIPERVKQLFIASFRVPVMYCPARWRHISRATSAKYYLLGRSPGDGEKPGVEAGREVELSVFLLLPVIDGPEGERGVKQSRYKNGNLGSLPLITFILKALGCAWPPDSIISERLFGLDPALEQRSAQSPLPPLESLPRREGISHATAL